MSDQHQRLMSEAEQHWERFAREDPEFYIAGQRSKWTAEAFYANGAEILAQYEDWIAPRGTERAIEIGSGLGRITVHLAPRFTHVHACDISSEMVRGAQRRELPGNIGWTVTAARLLHRRYPIPADHLSMMIRAAGLTIVTERGRGTASTICCWPAPGIRRHERILRYQFEHAFSNLFRPDLVLGCHATRPALVAVGSSVHTLSRRPLLYKALATRDRCDPWSILTNTGARDGCATDAARG